MGSGAFVVLLKKVSIPLRRILYTHYLNPKAFERRAIASVSCLNKVCCVYNKMNFVVYNKYKLSRKNSHTSTSQLTVSHYFRNTLFYDLFYSLIATNLILFLYPIPHAVQENIKFVRVRAVPTRT